MSHGEDDRVKVRRWWLRVPLKRVLVLFVVLVGIGVVLPFGCVGNRMFNTERDDYLRSYETDGELPYSVAVVEFDDQGVPWDLRQLDAALAEIRRLNRESEHGIVLYQFIHGWKSNAARDRSSGERLAWFERHVANTAKRSNAVARADGESAQPVVGLYIGWRGRTYSLPVLIDASFWNRRVAAHRVASMRLNEVLSRTVSAAKENADSKCILLGHSMGGMILEKTLGPVLVSKIMTVEYEGGSIPVRYDLIVAVNASTEALYTKQLIDVLRRTSVEMVLVDESGNRTRSAGPMLASITSEDDGVTKFMVPLAMTINSMFVRYRASENPTAPSQRRLGVQTAGHLPYLHSHSVEICGEDLVIRELPERWNDTAFWVFQVPAEVSADHSDIDSPLWAELMMRLMNANRVFDPDVKLRLVDVPATPG